LQINVLRVPEGYSGAHRAQSLNLEQAIHNQKRCYTQAVKTTEKQRGIMELKTPIKAETSFGMDVIVDADGDEIARELFGEHARRIVAAVNSCAGMTDEQVSHGLVSASVFSGVVHQRDQHRDGRLAALERAALAEQQRDSLLSALKRIMEIDCPLTGNPSHQELMEFWEYEKTQGRGEADDRMFALTAIAAVEQP